MDAPGAHGPDPTPLIPPPAASDYGASATAHLLPRLCYGGSIW
jgi:hypothetical protein